ncbi:dihydrofolate reductase [Glutamicibacter sp. 287]|uniref:dihydrofolate reductase n=1 Tax=unclassified Glutamicibacter TaxID=2627139 RepID=UPI0040346810
MSPRHATGQQPLIGAIWAQGANSIIGAAGSMPWHVPEDLAHFKAVTAGHPVIMGRNTWESFPAKFRPLPGRSNIVLTSRNQDQLRADGGIPAGGLREALDIARQSPGGEEIWIIGGGQLYAAALELLDVAVITRLDLSPAGDTTAPALPEDFKLSAADPAEAWHSSKSGIGYRFESWIREKD